eukprot:scaffold18853_cov78-Skeletonema_dohrnii-CCMP3373.AAC.1
MPIFGNSRLDRANSRAGYTKSDSWMQPSDDIVAAAAVPNLEDILQSPPSKRFGGKIWAHDQGWRKN